MTGLFKTVWDYFKRANDFWKDKTQPIKGKSVTDKLNSFQQHFALDSKEQNRLVELQAHEDGDKFIERKVDEINDYASHRAAFCVNAAAQFLVVNLSSISLLSFVPSSWFKVPLILANLLFAALAWRRIRTKKNKLIHGPSDEPEWSFWGIFRGNRRKHNRHIKEQAQPYKIRMRDERLFSILYLVNAVTLLFAGQLVLTDALPSFIQFVVNIPLFVITIPLAIANGYWAFGANNQVVKAATERGSKLDKLKL